MSRYKLRFVPQGAMPVDLNMGIHMTPVVAPGVALGVAPEPGCVPTCSGWGVTVNGDPSTGDMHSFAIDEAIAVRVEALGAEPLCDGQVIEWELRPLADPLDLFDSLTLTPDGAGAVDITADAPSDPDTFAGLLFALYATVEGQPFCETVIFGQCGDGLDCGDGWQNFNTGAECVAAGGFNSTLAYAWNFSSCYQVPNYFNVNWIFIPPGNMNLGTTDNTRITWVVSGSGVPLATVTMDPISAVWEDGWFMSIAWTDDTSETRPFSGSQFVFQAQLDGEDVCAPITIDEINTNPF